MSVSGGGGMGGAHEALIYMIKAYDMATPVFRAFGQEVNKVTAQVQASLSEMNRALAEQSRVVEQSSVKEREAISSVGRAQREAAVRSVDAAKVQADAAKRATAATEAQASATKRAAGSQTAAATTTAAAFGRQNAALSRFGRNSLIALAAVGVGSVDMAAKFDANTLRMQTQAGATTRQLDQIRQGLLKMAGQVGATPDQLANGMYHVVSAMNQVIPPAKRVSVELSIMKAAAEGAQVGHSNLEETTYALASAMNALHDSTGNAGKIMGILNATVGSGDMTMQDLINAFKSGIIPAANEFGVSIQSVGAALAVMGDMGMRGALAGTRLRMAISLLGAPTKQAAKILETLGENSTQAMASTARMSDLLDKAGVHVTKLSQDLRKPDGLQVALADLDHHLRSNGLSADAAAAAISRAFGGGRMGSAIMLMAENTNRLGLKFDYITKKGNQFGSDWEKTQATFRVQVDKALAALEAFGIKLGQALEPYALKALHALEDTANWLAKNKAAVDVLGATIITFATVAIGSYLVSKLKAAVELMKNFGGGMVSFGRYLVGMPAGGGGVAPSTPGASSGASGLLGSGAGIWGMNSTQIRVGTMMNPIAVTLANAGLAGGAASASERSAQIAGGVGPAAMAQNEAELTAARAEMAQAATLSAATEAKMGQQMSLLTDSVASMEATEAKLGEQLSLGSVNPVTTSVASGSAVARAETAAAGGVTMAEVKGVMGEMLSSLMRGGLIAGIGTIVAQSVGGMIGGGAGHAVSNIGTGAAIGAGIGTIVPGLGTLTGGVIGALTGAFATFVHNDAENYGKQMAKNFMAPMPKEVEATLGKKLASEAQKAHDLTQQAAFSPSTPATGAATGRGPNPRGAMFQQSGPLAAQQFKAFFNEGYTAGQSFVKGFDTVRIKSVPAFLQDATLELQRLPPKARNEAASVMVTYAASLEKHGELPRHATDTIIAALEQRYRSLGPYLAAQGKDNSKTIAATMSWQGAVNNLEDAEKRFRTLYGLWATDPNINGHTVVSAFDSEMTQLKADARGSTGKIHDIYVGAMQQLRVDGGHVLDRMVGDFNSKLGSASDILAHGPHNARWDKAAAQALTNFSSFSKGVGVLMASGAISTGKGADAIYEAMKKEMASFGGKPPTAVQLSTASAAASITAASSKAAGAVSGFLGLAAGGGWIGRPGERGRDEVPTLLGRGEAVLNHPQQSIVNDSLYKTGRGSLDHVFSATTSTRHHMATGGIAGRPSAGPDGYVYPIPGASIGRTDEGVDASMAPGSAIGPIGDSRIKGVIPSWYAGQPYLYWQLLAGPRAGQYAYVAEQITNLASPGSIVKANEAVARFASSGTGIEYGWATASGATLAKATTGYTEGQVTPAGADMARFLAGLAHGTIVGGRGGGLGIKTVTWKDILAPKAKGAGMVSDMVTLALKHITDAANALGRKAAAKASGGVGGAHSGTVAGPLVTASDFTAGPSTASGHTFIPGFAELSNPPGSLNFSALGGLPMGEIIQVSYNGKTISIPKIDVGAGGSALPPASVRAIDLSMEAAGQLGFSGLGNVTWHDTGRKAFAKGGRVGYAGQFGDGGMFTVNQPTMAMFGDKGPETVIAVPYSAAIASANVARYRHSRSVRTTNAASGGEGEDAGGSGGSDSSEGKDKGKEDKNRHRLLIHGHHVGVLEIPEAHDPFRATRHHYGISLLEKQIEKVSNKIFKEIVAAIKKGIADDHTPRLLELSALMAERMRHHGPFHKDLREEHNLEAILKSVEQHRQEAHNRGRHVDAHLNKHGYWFEQTHQLLKTHVHDTSVFQRNAGDGIGRLERRLHEVKDEISKSRYAKIENMLISAAFKSLSADVTAKEAMFTKHSTMVGLIEALAPGATLASMHMNPLQLKASGLSPGEIRRLAGASPMRVQKEQMAYITHHELPFYEKEAKRLEKLYHEAMITNNKKKEKAILKELDGITQAELKARGDYQQAMIALIDAQAQKFADKAGNQQYSADLLASIQNLAPGTSLSALGLTPKVLKGLGLSAKQARAMEGSSLSYLQDLEAKQGGHLTAAQIAAAHRGAAAENAMLAAERATDERALRKLEHRLPHLKGAARTDAEKHIQDLVKGILELTGTMKSNTDAVKALTSATNQNTTATGQMTGTVAYSYQGQNYTVGDRQTSDNAANVSLGI